MNMSNANYRIQNWTNNNGEYLSTKEQSIHNAGTGNDSWFTLEQARKIVLPTQRIIECTGTEILWEVC